MCGSMSILVIRSQMGMPSFIPVKNVIRKHALTNGMKTNCIKKKSIGLFTLKCS